MDARMLYLHALSPVHTGTGQGSDVIDLPVARERTTNWPYIPGSTIKGVLRTRCTSATPATKGSLPWQAFGPDTTNADDGAGALLFADGHLLCLPVRSLHGTIAWLTCPLALARHARDHVAAGLPTPSLLEEAPPSDDAIIVTPDSALRAAGEPAVYLEDLDLTARASLALATLATTIATAAFDDATWQSTFVTRFAVVSDTTFTFLAETATVVAARIRIDEHKKTVVNGALWYEEAVPAESIFTAPILAAPRNGTTSAELFTVVADSLNGLIQVGGHATVGRGLMRLRLGEGTR